MAKSTEYLKRSHSRGIAIFSYPSQKYHAARHIQLATILALGILCSIYRAHIRDIAIFIHPDSAMGFQYLCCFCPSAPTLSV